MADDDLNNRQQAGDEEEEECRVCRGPEEEGYPLFKPCKCKGSIGLTHQDCLQSWLEVRRADGRCELCKTKFQFAPHYAEGAPDRLPFVQVLSGILRRALSKWLPFVVRSVFAASLWLVVAPLASAYLYQGWMHRPGAILARLRWDLIPGDLVSGAVIAALVIISFLSLMSFADFLRVEVQQRGLRAEQAHRRRQGPEEPAMDPGENDIDNVIWALSQQQVVGRHGSNLVALDDDDGPGPVGLVHRSALDRALHGLGSSDDDEHEEDCSTGASENGEHEDGLDDDENEDLSDESWDHDSDDDDDYDVADEEREHRALLELQDMIANVHQDIVPLQPFELELERRFLNGEDNRNDDHPQRRQQDFRDPPRNDRNFDPELDDAIDMDINIALDELLGVRGPLSAVIRNLLWLLAFNTVYIGFFSCTPKLLGMGVVSMMTSVFKLPNATGGDNTTELQSVNLTSDFSLYNVLRAVEIESERQSTTFRLSDLVSVTVGYLICASIVLSLKLLWMFWKRVDAFRAGTGRTGNNDVEVREALDEINRIMLAGNFNDMNQMNEADQGIAVFYAVEVALDVTTAIVKVGVLLLLKMFLLPIALGLCLDISTLPIVGGSLETRVLYAGRDLFSFALMHWVAGITFMLLVTVSVLQLREVAHPQLLAQTIRPQEPQPDLLGNLMHETVATHGKRMFLSLLIYAKLLALHVYFPVRLLLSSGLVSSALPYLRTKLWYIMMPQLQVPLELLFFHLCVLGLLERNKNAIGELQHHWLKFVGGKLGMVESLLPRSVHQFRLIGSRPVYARNDLDPFWYDLAKADNDREAIVAKNIASFQDNPFPGQLFAYGETKPNGERILRYGSDFIRLPVRLPGRALRSRSVLLPTKIGRYRLARSEIDRSEHVFQLWEEVPGEPIPRPPEGWDDLGAGGADVQGRWAWGREKKSTVERGVAFREIYFDGRQSFLKSCKVIVLVALSWVTASVALFLLVGGPLVIGRFLYYVLRIPDCYIHDPFAFAVGSVFFFPLGRAFLETFVCTNEPLLARLRLWVMRYRPAPSTRKVAVVVLAVVLLYLVAPLLLGALVDVAFIKSSAWFDGEEPWADIKSLVMDWFFGVITLSVWSQLCVTGFFTRQFWVAMLQGGPAQPAAGDDGNPAEEGREVEPVDAANLDDGFTLLSSTWQGKDGRVGQCRDVLRSVLYDFEWDKVDSVVLIEKCAWPVTKQLALTLLWPMLTLIIGLVYPWPMTGIFRALQVRVILFIASTIQVGRVWDEQVLSWFDAAHRAARDERYLIGEILLDYQEAAS